MVLVAINRRSQAVRSGGSAYTRYFSRTVFRCMAQNRDISQLQIGMHNSYCILYREHVSGEVIVRMLYSCSPAVACPVATLVVHCSYTGT